MSQAWSFWEIGFLKLASSTVKNGEIGCSSSPIISKKNDCCSGVLDSWSCWPTWTNLPRMLSDLTFILSFSIILYKLIPLYKVKFCFTYKIRNKLFLKKYANYVIKQTLIHFFMILTCVILWCFFILNIKNTTYYFWLTIKETLMLIPN